MTKGLQFTGKVLQFKEIEAPYPALAGLKREGKCLLAGYFHGIHISIQAGERESGDLIGMYFAYKKMKITQFVLYFDTA
ncbi:MAG: hypothetical protein JRJ02_04380 [Deltaproteobacteria bacterium]|nr:hypothetical protein [Deltaproteobacteria bacterium]MBW1861595.1 hypothetical protein [Deltaproteobacteria bacterium]